MQTARLVRYITTPIYYVNDKPHMGHAYASIHADVMARYYRAAGMDVYMLSGTDEHGEKIAKAAAAAGQDIQAFVDHNASLFQQAWALLDVQPDQLVRTTAPAHKQVVSLVLQRLYEAGDIYQAEYEGLYSIGQERYVTEKELVEGKLPEDKDPPQHRRETNYFFRMEQHRDGIRQYLTDHPELIQPPQYRNEILELLNEPIGDLSISRPASRLAWGIPIPWDASQVTYVWFDALLSYVSALGYPGEAAYARYWPEARHVIGKDILRTHTLFWLSMCRAIGLTPYQRLHVSGHLLGSDGRKMSKSLGNGVDPLDAARRHGVDILRYTLVREVSFGLDGVISEQVLIQRRNHDLANDLGNLAARSIAMVQQYRDGRAPAPSSTGELEQALVTRAQALPAEVLQAVEAMRLAQACELVMVFVRQLNQYIAQTRPWELAKQADQAARLDTVLYTLLEGLRVVADLLAPVMPTKMLTLRQHLGLTGACGWNQPWGEGLQAGSTVMPLLLFPKAV
ncbi:methionine--tRNA ligase [Chitinimonas prasina]|uniref:Methionine--tRNA ligase n=1 Tax=Chitinimonas prasina TaxID=1434937 RepID=A0ABQ5YNU8_9NEIS|nr:methionine--tRNA ligase [Chitinimonas prasina]GLR14624.1 methionine--tRNA ligase [Chitinimonas prasina]